jgi:hypothetical protein
VFEVPVLNGWMTLDFGSNLAMLACCIWGYRIAPAGYEPA